jgi:hypothetical protein
MADEARPETPLDYSDVATAYSNWYQVLGTPEEIIVEFGLSPNLGIVTAEPVRIKQRMVMSFYTAKRLVAHLHYAIRRYESVFGELEIDVPTLIRSIVGARDQTKKAA